jgi:hypothetical protein
VWSGEAVFNLLAWLPSGIYFGRHSTGPEPAGSNPFLWKVDPTTKAAEQIYPPSGTPATALKYSWGWMTPHAAWGNPIGGDTSLVRLDLATRTVSQWRPSLTSAPRGFDGNENPIVYLAGKLTVLRGSDDLVIDAELSFRPITLVADGHSLWFGQADGAVWLSSPDRGLRKMATLPTLPTISVPARPPGALGIPPIPDFLVPAGPCV